MDFDAEKVALLVETKRTTFAESGKSFLVIAVYSPSYLLAGTACFFSAR